MEIHPNWMKDSTGMLYAQLYQYFREEIRSRRIPPGTRLPSVRALSRNLHLSKTTVETAYHQLLAEGYIESRERSGFYVVEWEEEIGEAAGISRDFPWLEPIKNSDGQEKVKRQSVEKENTARVLYDFHHARVDADHFPYEIWRRYSNQCLQRENREILYYGDPQGELVLREQIASYLQKARGVHAHADAVVIGAGTQLLIQLLCWLFGRESQSIAMEEPGYNGVRSVFVQNGYQVIPIPLDEDGIQVEVLEASRAPLVYVTPSHQEPLGAVMPYAKRSRLLQWAARTGAYLIEDDYDGEFRYQTKPIPSLQGMDQAGRVIYLGTFSKSLLPSIRISYMVLPPELLRRYQERLREFDQSCSRIHQETLALFMKNGEWERHIRKMRTLYSKKHQAMLSSLHEQFGERIRVMGHNAGLSMTVEVASLLTAEELARVARSAGIRVYPATPKWMAYPPGQAPVFQFGFGGLSTEEIAAGIHLLKETWEPYLPGPKAAYL
ncbi:PLP-dependent aminotransferase family protein [Brevibacillus ruminantium]|uniref:PLP-dependent aminotransferase family protein n=1 Tax=Brevibacillus ruminantium TaxID=2950604 RepID=A0ABY4WH19_9BACL|nr:PLP-dependent aminotransferase family protein [Brevibacillus ruminantium]USG66417.1 PLP-dependent aminotransferase family protein [Brevibacillus ruminantium]